jgi:hypothetical protein
VGASGTNKWEEALGIDEHSKQIEALERATIKKDQVAVDSEVHDLNFKHEDVVEAARTNLNFLAAFAMPAVFQYFFPRLLLAVWQLLVDSSGKVRDFTQLALGIPRGHAKTTLIKLFVLYCILFTQKKFILVISSTASLAENIIADVVDMLNEPNVKKTFGDWRVGLEKDTQDTKKFTFRGRTVILAAIGAEGSLRGLNLKNERPDVMIFEDIQTAECADSKVQSNTLERWMVGTAMKAKSPHGCLYIFVGNMFPTPYSILRKLKKNPRWIKFICGAILTDGTALWEELQPLEQLLSELDNDIAMGHEEVFAAEVLNDENAKLHTRADLLALNEWLIDETVISPQGKFIVIDPATKKVGSDLITIGQFNVYDSVPALMHLIEDSLSPGDTIKHTLLLALKTNTTLIGVESTAYQASLLYWFEFICKQLGIAGIEFVELHSGSFSKSKRITDGIKMLSGREMLLHPRVKGSVIGQLTGWNPLKRDNVDGILDILGYAPQMLEKYGHLMSIEGEIINQEYENSTVVAVNCQF